MLAFKLWSQFGAFRDPLGISQHITFPIPPKTTVGGIMGSIIGKTPEEIFNEADYFDFRYSVVLLSPVRKKSFAQNYIGDLTKTGGTRLDEMKKFSLGNPKNRLLDLYQQGFKKEGAKPTYRELLLNPEYLIVIRNFKHEAILSDCLQNHYTHFPVYMGNSEFSANFQNISCTVSEEKVQKVDSFTQNIDQIDFDFKQQYTSLKMATKVIGQREYADYQQLVISHQAIRFQSEIDVTILSSEEGTYRCEFI